MRYTVFLAVLLTLSACRSNPLAPFELSDTTPQLISETDYTVTESGLKIFDIREGTGSFPRPGFDVAVHFEGWLSDGMKFDSSRDSGERFIFPLGVGRVIPGWDEGVATMRFGGIRQIVIPPALAYGSNSAGRGRIPPNSTLIFEIELFPPEAR